MENWTVVVVHIFPSHTEHGESSNELLTNRKRGNTLNALTDILGLDHWFVFVTLNTHIQAQIQSPSSVTLLSPHWSSHPALSDCRPEGESRKNWSHDPTRFTSTNRERAEKLPTWEGDVFGLLWRWLYKKENTQVHIRPFLITFSELAWALSSICASITEIIFADTHTDTTVWKDCSEEKMSVTPCLCLTTEKGCVFSVHTFNAAPFFRLVHNLLNNLYCYSELNVIFETSEPTVYNSYANSKLQHSQK